MRVYTDDEKIKMFEKVCNAISEHNMSLRSALELSDTPPKSTFLDWVAKDKQMSDQYARAIEQRTDNLFEELIEIAEDRDDVQYTDEEGNIRVDNGAVQAKRLEIDTKKWALSKMNPKKYSDKINIGLSGTNDEPLKVEIID